MRTNRQGIARRVADPSRYSFFRAVILSFSLFIAILFPAIGFGNEAFYYTANEGGSISKVDASANKLIKTIKLDEVVHNFQNRLKDQERGSDDCGGKGCSWRSNR